MLRARRLVLTTIVVLLTSAAICGSAWGATAKLVEISVSSDIPGEPAEKFMAPALIADPGEANRVRVSPGSIDKTVLIEELGATLTVGAGCVSVDASHARCDNNDGRRTVIAAGDLADVVVASANVAVEAQGGPGVDVLVGSGGADSLFGDGGAGDVLAGLGGDDLLSDDDATDGAAIDADTLDGGPGSDTASYATRTAAVRVDLSDSEPDGQPGEGDKLTSIEDVEGGRGADRLTGSVGPNLLTGGPGDDVIDGGAGGDEIGGSAGADRISSGAGADLVTGGKGDDRISLGSGNDIIDDRVQRTPTGTDQISCGSGVDQFKATTEDKAVDRLQPSCELFTAAERAADGNIVADFDAVTARLRGVRRSQNTVLVPVKCARSKSNPACVIGGELRATGSGATLAKAMARLRLKAGRNGTLRMQLTRAGRAQVRRGSKVGLLIADRTTAKGIELLERARAQVQIFIP